jgi:glycosyltransferase involved in cell wall biosynthesis
MKTDGFAVATETCADENSTRTVLNLMYHADLKFGGIAHSVPALCANVLAHSRCRNQMMAVTSPDEATFDPQTATLSLRRVNEARWRPLSEGRIAAELSRMSPDFDVLHVHGIWGPHCAAGCSHAARTKRPYIVSIHGMLTPWALAYKKWRKKLYWNIAEKHRLARAHCIRALNHEEAKDVRQVGLETPICVIPNGVSTPPASDAEGLFVDFPELRGARLTLYMSRVVPYKGPELLCRAWAAARLPEEHRLLIAGPAEARYDAHLRQLTRELGIERSVHLLGMISGERKAAALRASTFFSLPSESEGLSNAVLEAMASGLVPIVTEGCRFPEAESSGAGLVVKRDVASLAEALAATLALPGAAVAERSAKARQLIERRYAWKAVVRQMVQVYEWAAGGPFPTDAQIV